MIQLKHKVSFTDRCKRDNNEDFAGSNRNQEFVVCDGVGGRQKGEIASEIVAKTFLKAYQLGEVPIEKTLAAAESNITDFIRENPDSMGMATTLAYLKVFDHGVLLAWIGDSRIYQFRNNRIVYQTRDHSWVNEALDQGIITQAEAPNHPKSNVITRAIVGSHNPTEIESVFITDVQADDYFFLCSDGVLETWTNEELIALFAENQGTEAIAQKIKLECQSHSKDNSTGIVFQISSITKDNSEPIAPKPSSNSKDKVNKTSILSGINKKTWLIIAACGLFVIALAIYLMSGKKAAPNTLPPTTEQPAETTPPPSESTTQNVPKEKDTDGDGVMDAEDQCVDEKGTKSNRGCPEKEPLNAENNDLNPDNPLPNENTNASGNENAPKGYKLKKTEYASVLTDNGYENFWGEEAKKAGERYKFVKGKLYIKFTSKSNWKATEKDFEFIRAKFFQKVPEAPANNNASGNDKTQ
jgi:protein phosphatase